jgi:hypothetical protein
MKVETYGFAQTWGLIMRMGKNGGKIIDINNI